MVSQINWDKNTIVITAVLSFLSVNLESVNLFLSIVLKIATLANIIIYIIVNWRRIIIACKRITKKRKK